MAITQQYLGTLTVETCCACGITFGMDDSFHAARVADHGDFYCPSGHNQHFVGETEVQKQKRLRIAAEARAARWEDRADHERRSKIALKGHLTRARNKIAAGLCPVPDCGQHFGNVREHMKFKHPDFHLVDPETGEQVNL